MIEHKFLVIKKLDEAARELDKLMAYEGFVVLCCVGKKNNTLLLRRVIENPQQEIQYEQPLSPPSNKRNTKKGGARFPNAVHQ